VEGRGERSRWVGAGMGHIRTTRPHVTEFGLDAVTAFQGVVQTVEGSDIGPLRS
jgi:hypothetical protein